MTGYSPCFIVHTIALFVLLFIAGRSLLSLTAFWKQLGQPGPLLRHPTPATSSSACYSMFCEIGSGFPGSVELGALGTVN